MLAVDRLKHLRPLVVSTRGLADAAHVIGHQAREDVAHRLVGRRVTRFHRSQAGAFQLGDCRMQGLGGTLLDELAYDDEGQLLTGSFMDYAMPGAVHVPEVRLAHQETPSALNPLGLKGAGEAGTVPVPAVIANAVEDALRPLHIGEDAWARNRRRGRDDPGRQGERTRRDADEHRSGAGRSPSHR